MVTPHGIDTTKPSAVAEALKSLVGEVGGEDHSSVIVQAVADIAEMFEGNRPGYQAIDMEYHDLDHTLQVTICMAHLLNGRADSGDTPKLSGRDWEMAILSALLHDTGFIKEIGDDEGTGAKYTFVHERRSCIFARKYLPERGFSPTEIEDICSAMMCTGPRNQIASVTFQRQEAREIAVMLVTADYLAQMSAADYLEKLPLLYHEFIEAFEHEEISPEDRPYQSYEQLLEMTPGFWSDFVLPLLDGEAQGVYRYAGAEGKPNPYLRAIAANLEELKMRLAAGKCILPMT